VVKENKNKNYITLQSTDIFFSLDFHSVFSMHKTGCISEFGCIVDFNSEQPEFNSYLECFGYNSL
jgi:hypothetical protein